MIIFYTDPNTGLMGLKNKSGTIITNPKYKTITNFCEGYAVVEYLTSEANKCKTIFAFVDENGNETIIKCQKLLPFKNGLSAVFFDGSWKLINKNFEFIPCKTISNNPEDIYIDDINILTKLTEIYGYSVLHWASPTSFTSEKKYQILKNSLKKYLRKFACKIGAKKDGLTKQQFMNLVIDQFKELQDLRWNKIQQVQEWNSRVRATQKTK